MPLTRGKNHIRNKCTVRQMIAIFHIQTAKKFHFVISKKKKEKKSIYEWLTRLDVSLMFVQCPLFT